MHGRKLFVRRLAASPVLAPLENLVEACHCALILLLLLCTFLHGVYMLRGLDS